MAKEREEEFKDIDFSQPIIHFDVDLDEKEELNDENK